LILKAKDGDQSAYTQLMNQYHDSILFEISKRIRDEELARDLTMEAMSKALMNLDAYQPTFAFSTWLKRVSVNHTIDYLRKRKLETYSMDAAQSSEKGELVRQYASDELSPQEKMEKSQRIDIVRHYIQKLKDMYRSLIELRYYNELSYEEIAVELAIPVGTVKARLHRAKRMLGQMMAPHQATF
jgi:RNA polymerase sigma factor (sigma-70 family)